MRRPHRFLVFLALLAASCGSSDGDLPSGWTLNASGISVEVRRSPYRIVVKDARGERTLLESLGPGTGDGYASVGFARGTLKLSNLFSQAYFRPDLRLEPWRDDLEVVAAALTGETALDLTLAGHGGAERVLVHLAVSASTLRVEAHLDGGEAPRAWTAAFRSPGGEGFLGLGERFTRTNFRGLSMYSFLEEGGIGSGENDPPGEANPWPNGESMAYYPVPFFISTAGYGVWLDTTYYNRFDLATPERADAWRALTVSPTLAYEVYVPIPGDARPWPYHLIDLFTARTGRPMVPPAWAFGPRRRINHGAQQGAVSELQAMRDLDLAITTMDDTYHYLPNGNTPESLAALPAAIAEARRLGYRVVGYYNSFFSTKPEDPIAAVTQAGVNGHHFLSLADGSPARTWIISGDNLAYLHILDFTSPAATAFYQSLLDRGLTAGHSGWMYDFGEYVPQDVVAANGMTGEELHNLYPVLYQKAAFDHLESTSHKGDWLTFVRSGYTGASQYSPMVWSGDPAASFDSADGLPSMVRAGINIGISGVPIWGGDISGYHCLSDGAERADGELLTRWIQHGSMTPDMHDESACTGGDSSLKANIFRSLEGQAAWKTYARLHTRLQPYFRSMAKLAHETGAPIIRHIFLDNPDRADWAGVDDVYALGPALLVAPVVARGARQKRIDLPPGRWLDWQAPAVLQGGAPVTLDAPLAKLPLLLKQQQLVPLLDPRIDTLDNEETHPDVIGPADVADVYDVVGFLAAGAGAARFDLWDGGSLEARLEGAPAAPALPEAATEAELATCTGCWRIDPEGPDLTRVRISVEREAASSLQAGGLTLRAETGRRVRWDLHVVK